LLFKKAFAKEFLPMDHDELALQIWADDGGALGESIAPEPTLKAD
jgi:hypothetical protein